MSDHAIGLIGLALAVVSIVAPFRWREMPRWATDIGILVGAILAGIAIAPYAYDAHLSAPSLTDAPTAKVYQDLGEATQRDAYCKRSVEVLQAELQSCVNAPRPEDIPKLLREGKL